MKFSMPNVLLRLEGLAVMTAGVLLYFHFGGQWQWFWLLLWPDIGLLGYLAGNRAGSVIYNLFHFYVFPVVIIAFCLLIGQNPTWLLLALLWAAHIGMDRLLGFGLKYPFDFKQTHIQKM